MLFSFAGSFLWITNGFPYFLDRSPSHCETGTQTSSLGLFLAGFLMREPYGHGNTKSKRRARKRKGGGNWGQNSQQGIHVYIPIFTYSSMYFLMYFHIFSVSIYFRRSPRRIFIYGNAFACISAAAPDFIMSVCLAAPFIYVRQLAPPECHFL